MFDRQWRGDALEAIAGASSRTLQLMQVTSQCRVDAPPDWVRSFLLAGTREDDVTVDGDVIEVRQRDRLIDLVVRNRLSSDGEGGTVLDVDADLRLLGLARVVGGLFHRRVRRTLERGLDRLPTAMEQALEGEQGEHENEAREEGAAARRAEEGAGG
jgi:carbon monoxide dehydrogenase subunit G